MVSPETLLAFLAAFGFWLGYIVGVTNERQRKRIKHVGRIKPLPISIDDEE